MNNSKRIAISLFVLSLASLVFMQCQEKLISYSKKRNSIRGYTHLNDSTLLLNGIASDSSFGRIDSKPIMLGMYEIEKAAENVEQYLNALTGPQGEPVAYQRLKPCCPFKTKNFILNYPMLTKEFNGKYGMLEKYSVSYTQNQQIKSTILYINIYDESKELLAPQGFRYKTSQ